jgi:hypothetical protein
MSIYSIQKPSSASSYGKEIEGRKRHALVDTDGRALKNQARAADIQDRDGAGPLLRASRPSWPFVQCVFADAGYQGRGSRQLARPVRNRAQAREEFKL